MTWRKKATVRRVLKQMKNTQESLGARSVHPMVCHSELQPEAQATSSPEPRKTGESLVLGTCVADVEEHGGASEA